MSLLLEDLAEDTAVGLSRTVERFEAAEKELSRPDAPAGEVALFARHITAYALAEVPRAEAVWQWDADQSLREPTEVERRWLALQSVFALQARLCIVAGRAWKRAEALGASAERGDELRAARLRFERLAHHMKTAIDHRKDGWQPKDAERYADEMRRHAEGTGKAVTADEARRWFRAAAPPAEG